MWIFVIFFCSTFLGELEKCLEEPKRLGGIFIRYVSFQVFIFNFFFVWIASKWLMNKNENVKFGNQKIAI